VVADDNANDPRVGMHLSDRRADEKRATLLILLVARAQSKDASDGLLVLVGGEPASAVTLRVTATIFRPKDRFETPTRHELPSCAGCVAYDAD